MDNGKKEEKRTSLKHFELFRHSDQEIGWNLKRFEIFRIFLQKSLTYLSMIVQNNKSNFLKHIGNPKT